jgi:hypothetical protein
MLDLLFKEHPGRCGIDTLPEEIWTDIIRIYATKDVLDFFYVSVDLLLPLMLVSNLWWRRIQETPTLWTDIVLTTNKEDLSLSVALGLHYSNAASLSLYLLSGGTWLAVRSMASSMQRRITGLFFHLLFPKHEAELVLSDLLPFPTLTRLSPPLTIYLDIGFFQKHPLITDLRTGSSPTELCAYLPRLTRLEWLNRDKGGTAAILGFLGRIQGLKEVYIGHPHVGEEDGNYPQDFGSPAWTHLRYGLHNHTVHSVLLNQTRNTLVYLCLEASISTLVNHLSLTLPELERLDSLQVTLVKDQDDISLVPPPRQKICSVRNMKIVFIFLDEYHNTDVPTMVSRLLHRMMEYVEIISISSRRLQYIPLLFAEIGFPRLRSIIIVDSFALDSDGAHLQQFRLPSSLDCLNLTGPETLLRTFASTTVTNVQFKGAGSRALEASELSQWSNLRILSLARIKSSFHHFSLPTLRVLSIDIPRQMATALCQQLAIYGDRCPSLERLEFSDCPEWDIFMIMLERRNCKPDSGVTPIKYIVLPARVPRIVRSAIRERIQGRRSPRPSNYELSLQGNNDILRDSNL